MARPREFDEHRVVDAIMLTFWEKGYEATSMQDLVATTGMLKGSLYGAFGDKQALYLMALERYDKTHIQAGIDQLSADGTVQEKIARLFDAVLESVRTDTFAGGCLLCNASMERAPVDTSVQKLVEKQINRLHKAVCIAIAPLTPGASQCDSLAGYIVTAYFGTRVIAKSGMSDEMIIATRDQCLSALG
ncbi:MAG: TetR/AcrR family transcriptional regulator [Pseudomonadota bacterium]